MKLIPYLAAAVAVTLTLAGPALAADAKKGKKVYNKCKACHVIDSDKNKSGPTLKGVMGRKAGTAPGFKRYSKAMMNSGITWDEKTLAAYLKDPKGYIPKNRMTFRGLKKQNDIDNVIAYMKEASK